MRIRFLAALSAAVLFATSGVWGQSTQGTSQQADPPPQHSGPVFRAVSNLILVNVDVRDKSGQPIKGLKQSDFQVFEDGKPQDIQKFVYEEVEPTKTAIITASMLKGTGTGKGAVPIVAAAPAKVAPKPADAATPEPETKPIVDANDGPLTSDEVAGHRVWVLMFDTSSMQPDDVQRAVDSATKWSNERMSPSDLVALLTVSSQVQQLQDFTNDKSKIQAALKQLSAADGTASAATDVDASTMSSDEANNAATTADTTVDQSAQEIDSFNNDVRLRAIKTVCDKLNGIQQKKALMYWSSGMQRNGTDNQVELRAMEQSCVRANVALDTIDARGLQAVPPGGNARTASRGGVGAFSGRNVASQFTQLAAQQETLQAMAADTGGEAFTDSNDFGEAFDKVEKAISAYYLIGYSSSNPNMDGRYRRIDVKFIPKMDVKMDARKGYYADRDFTHLAKEDRETAILEQLDIPIPATDVPMFVSAGYFRQSGSQTCPGMNTGFRGGRGGPGGPGGDQTSSACYFVPVSITVPGDAVPPQKDKATTLDVRGYIRDERGAPIATIKQTLTVPPATTDSLAQKQILYQTGALMPPGLYRLKVAIRENTTGQMGTDEIIVKVPDLKAEPVKVSSVVLSTQLQSVPADYKTNNPLVQGGVEIMPNLTHVVNHDQKMYFYYEVYDPSQTDSHPQIRTNLAFYRGKVKVFETPVVERTTLDVPDRKAAIFRFVVPENSLKSGFYTCQVNIVDEAGGKFSFPRLDMYVR
jgi:VWFA-related protein